MQSRAARWFNTFLALLVGLTASLSVVAHGQAHAHDAAAHVHDGNQHRLPGGNDLLEHGHETHAHAYLTTAPIRRGFAFSALIPVSSPVLIVPTPVVFIDTPVRQSMTLPEPPPRHNDTPRPPPQV